MCDGPANWVEHFANTINSFPFGGFPTIALAFTTDRAVANFASTLEESASIQLEALAGTPNHLVAVLERAWEYKFSTPVPAMRSLPEAHRVLRELSWGTVTPSQESVLEQLRRLVEMTPISQLEQVFPHMVHMQELYDEFLMMDPLSSAPTGVVVDYEQGWAVIDLDSPHSFETVTCVSTQKTVASGVVPEPLGRSMVRLPCISATVGERVSFVRPAPRKYISWSAQRIRRGSPPHVGCL